jgi:hypothetical protein
MTGVESESIYRRCGADVFNPSGGIEINIYDLV